MKILFVAPVGNFGVVDGGYGNASMGILKTLVKMQEDPKVDYITEIDCFSTLNLNNVTLPDKKYDVVILVTHPNSFANPIVKNIFFELLSLGERSYLSVVWETEPLPKEWEWLWKSENFTGFLAPSKFVGEQICKLTEKPVFYYPHSIDTSEIPNLEVETKLKEQLFTVLFVGQYTKRKGIEDAIVSFANALGDKEDACLLLKYHEMSKREVPLDQLLASLVKTNSVGWKASIYSLTDKLNGEDMYKLYRSSSVLLTPTRGEGFGLTAAEAMASGIPVIYTNWSACPEVAEAEGNIPIDYTVDSAIGMAHHGYSSKSNYAIPKMLELIDALKKKYNLWKIDKKKYYEEVKGNREVIDKRFGYDVISNCLKDIITNNLDRIIKK